MAKFRCYKESGEDTITTLGVVNTLEAAIELCVREIYKGWPNEVAEARKALSLRRYYGCGYSNNQYGIEEVD